MKKKTETELIIEQMLNEDEKLIPIWEEVSAEVDFAFKLRKAREEKGLTQKDISLKTGIAQSEISKIENASISPTITTLLKYLDGIGKGLDII